MSSEDIIFIGGSKGGVGKSMVSSALIDYVRNIAGKPVFLIETDTSNPDVYKAYKDIVDHKLINIDESDGWVDMMNTIAEKPDYVFVINSAARASVCVKKYGEILNGAGEGLKRRLITLWVINRQRDSLELLKEFLSTMDKSEIHVLMNNFFGEPTKYVIYNDSQLKKDVESRGGKSVSFPDVADRVADELNMKRFSVEKALTEMPYGNRVELERWRGAYNTLFAELLR
jgi:hypothetical protein